MILKKLKSKIKRGIIKLYFKISYRKRFKFGKRLIFRKQFLIETSCTGLITIGNNCFFNNCCSINSFGDIKIGNDCIFGENVKLYDHNHAFNIRGTLISQSGYKIGTIEIGDNCRIGTNSVILKGAKIGKGCVIGAGCIIDSEIPPFSIVTMERKLIVKSRNEL